MSESSTMNDAHTLHLSELDADLLLAGELDADDPRVLHLAECDECAAYVAALERADAEFREHMPASFTELDARRGARRGGDAARHARRGAAGAATSASFWRAVAISAAAACAVCVGVIAWPGSTDPAVESPPEQIRIKASYDMVVYVHDGDRSRVASAGEEVHPGDRVGFKIVPAPRGHVMIVGIDQTGETYIGYPQDSGGRSRELAMDPKGIGLEQALELDDVLGRERLVMLVCPDAFSFDDVARRASNIERAVELDVLPSLLPGCIQRERSLNKRSR